MDVNLRIREIFRDPMLQDKAEDSNDEISKPVQGQPTHDFGRPLPTQHMAARQVQPPNLPPGPAPADLLRQAANAVQDGPGTGEGLASLQFRDLDTEKEFFEKGFGEAGAQLLDEDGLLQDRMLLRRVLTQGSAEIKLKEAVDMYYVHKGEGKRKKKHRPTQGKAGLRAAAPMFSLSTD